MHCHCCKEAEKVKEAEALAQQSNEVQLWLNMMKYMLECADMSMEVMRTVRDQLDISEKDIEKFSELSEALDRVRHQLTSLGENTFRTTVPPLITPAQDFTESPLSKKGCCSLSLEKNKKIVDREPSKTGKDACLCGVFPKSVVQSSRQREVRICSPLNRESIQNRTCRHSIPASGGNETTVRNETPKVVETPQREEKPINIEQRKEDESPKKIEDWPNDDNHPYIVKDIGGITFREDGLGFELFRAMKRYKNKVAQYVEATDESQTFAELLRDCSSVAIKLRQKGLTPDDIICLCLSNSKQGSMIYISGFFVGCQMNAVDTSFCLRDLVYLLSLVTPTVMFVQKENVPVVQETMAEAKLNIHLITVGGTVEGLESIDDYLQASDDEIKKFKPYRVDSLSKTCIVLFSSGTAGEPKGICLSHLTVMNQCTLCALTGNVKSVFLSFTTYYWISAVVFICSCVLTGTPRVIALPFEVQRIYTIVPKYKVDTMFIGPLECLMLLRSPRPMVDMSCLRCLITGGAVLKDVLFYGLRKLFPGCMVFQVYGQTEVAGLLLKWASNNPEDRALCAARPLSAGRPFGGFWYKIIDEDGKILGPNEQGELCVKSDCLIMKGYFNRDSSETFDKQGWLKTGDLVKYDEYHCFYVIDRIKELIKFKMWHISPCILEHILMAHPAVSRAVVVGIPNEEDVEHPVGLIMLQPGIDPATVDLKEIEEFVNKQVDDRKRLRGGVRIIKKIPLTATGKVKRRDLRQAILHDEEM